MRSINKVSRDSLEKWSAWVFLVAGVLMLVPSARSAIELVTAISFSGTITGLFGFAGIVLSYIGLIGLSPQLIDETPRLAQTGLVLMGLPAIVIVVLIGWVIGTLIVPAIPSMESTLPAPAMVFRSVFLLFALGTTSFGVASLRSRVPSRTVGVLLLILAANWFVILVAMLVFSGTFPPWVSFITWVGGAGPLVAIGYSMWRGREQFDRTAGAETTA